MESNEKMEMCSKELAECISCDLFDPEVQPITKHLITAVIMHAEKSYELANKAYNYILRKDFDIKEDPWNCYKNSLKLTFKAFTVDVRNLFPSFDLKDTKIIIGITTFMGLLYRKNLVEGETVIEWLETVLVSENQLFRMSLLEVIREKVEEIVESGFMDKVTMRLKREIFEAGLERKSEDVVMATREEIEKFESVERRVDKILIINDYDMNDSFYYAGKKLLIEIYEHPEKLNCTVKAFIYYTLMAPHRSNFTDYFSETHYRKIKHWRNLNEIKGVCAELQYEIFMIEVLIRNKEPIDEYIEELANRMLYFDESRTTCFLLIFHKYSSILRTKHHEVYKLCLIYVKQLDLNINERLNDDFWKHKFSLIMHEYSEDGRIEFIDTIDDDSLTRAKFRTKLFITQKIRISSLKYEPANVNNRLLLLHIEYLLEVRMLELFETSTKDNQQIIKFIEMTAKFFKINPKSKKLVQKLAEKILKSDSEELQRILKKRFKKLVKKNKDPQFKLCGEAILQENRTAKSLFSFLSYLHYDICRMNDFKKFKHKLYRVSLEEYAFFIHNNFYATEIYDKLVNIWPSFHEILCNLYDDIIEYYDKEMIVDEKLKLIPYALERFYEEKSVYGRQITKVISIFRKISENVGLDQNSYMCFIAVITLIGRNTKITQDTNLYLEYINCLEHLYDLNGSLIYFNNRNIDKIMIEVSPFDAIAVHLTNPSFSMIFGGDLNPNIPKVCHPIRIKSSDSAIYFLMNACNFDAEIYCDYLMSFYDGTLTDCENLKTEFKEEATKLIDMIYKFILQYFKDFCNYCNYYNNEVDPVRDEMLKTCLKVINYIALNRLIKIEQVCESLNYFVDIHVTRLDLTENFCFKTLFNSCINLIDQETERNVWQRLINFKRGLEFTLENQNIECLNDITSKPIEFAQLKSKKTKIAARMIIKSIWMLDNPCKEILKKYYNYCKHIRNYRQNFEYELDVSVKGQCDFYIDGPIKKNLNWKSIGNLGKFLVQILEDEDSEMDETFSYFFNEVYNRAMMFDQDDLEIPGSLEYVKFFLDLAKITPEVCEDRNIIKLDYLFMKMNTSSEEFRSTFMELIAIFDQTLGNKIFENQDKVAPSFKRFVSERFQPECRLYFINVNDVKECANLFFKTVLKGDMHVETLITRLIEITQLPRRKIFCDPKEILPEIHALLMSSFEKEFSERANVEKKKRQINIFYFLIFMYKNKLLSNTVFWHCSRTFIAYAHLNASHEKYLKKLKEHCEIHQELKEDENYELLCASIKDISTRTRMEKLPWTNCIQMMFENLINLPEVNLTTIAEYSRSTAEFQKHADFKSFFNTQLTNSLFEDGINQKSLANLGKFFACLMNCNFTEFKHSFLIFLSVLRDKITEDEEFTTLYVNIVKNYPVHSLRITSKILDSFYQQAQNDSMKDKKIYEEITELLDATLELENSNENIAPSFKILIDGIKQRDTTHIQQVSIDDLKACVLFFVDNAIYHPKKYLQLFVEEMEKWEHDLASYEFIEGSQTDFLKLILTEMLILKVEDKHPKFARRFYGLNSFVVEANYVRLINQEEFEEFATRVIELAFSSPSELLLLCFHILTIEKNVQNRATKFRTFKKYQDNESKLIELRKMLELIDCNPNDDDLDKVEHKKMFNRRMSNVLTAQNSAKMSQNIQNANQGEEQNQAKIGKKRRNKKKKKKNSLSQSNVESNEVASESDKENQEFGELSTSQQNNNYLNQNSEATERIFELPSTKKPEIVAAELYTKLMNDKNFTMEILQQNIQLCNSLNDEQLEEFATIIQTTITTAVPDFARMDQNSFWNYYLKLASFLAQVEKENEVMKQLLFKMVDKLRELSMPTNSTDGSLEFANFFLKLVKISRNLLDEQYLPILDAMFVKHDSFTEEYKAVVGKILKNFHHKFHGFKMHDNYDKVFPSFRHIVRDAVTKTDPFKDDILISDLEAWRKLLRSFTFRDQDLTECANFFIEMGILYHQSDIGITIILKRENTKGAFNRHQDLINQCALTFYNEFNEVFLGTRIHDEERQVKILNFGFALRFYFHDSHWIYFTNVLCEVQSQFPCIKKDIDFLKYYKELCSVRNDVVEVCRNLNFGNDVNDIFRFESCTFHIKTKTKQKKKNKKRRKKNKNQRNVKLFQESENQSEESEKADQSILDDFKDSNLDSDDESIHRSCSQFSDKEEEEEEDPIFDLFSFRLLIQELKSCSPLEIQQNIASFEYHKGPMRDFTKGLASFKVMASEIVDTYLSDGDAIFYMKVVEAIHKVCHSFGILFSVLVQNNLVERLGKFDCGIFDVNLENCGEESEEENQENVEVQELDQNQNESQEEPENLVESQEVSKKKRRKKKKKPQKILKMFPDMEVKTRDFKFIQKDALKAQKLKVFLEELIFKSGRLNNYFDEIIPFDVRRQNYNLIVAKMNNSLKIADFIIKHEKERTESDNFVYEETIRLLKKTQKLASFQNNKITSLHAYDICTIFSTKLIDRAIFGDSEAYARHAKQHFYCENVNPYTISINEVFMEIFVKKFQNYAENENSSNLAEIYGAFDFLSALFNCQFAKVSNLDEIFEIFLLEKSKLLVIFFKTFASTLELAHPDILEFYLESIEMHLKFDQNFANVVLEILEMRENGWKKLKKENSKIEEFFQNLNEENFRSKLIKFRKVLMNDFETFITKVWQILLENSQSEDFCLKILRHFEFLPKFRSQLDHFLTQRRRSLLQISLNNFNSKSRQQCTKVWKFVRKLSEMGTIDEKQFKLWTKSDVLKRLEENEMKFALKEFVEIDKNENFIIREFYKGFGVENEKQLENILREFYC